MDEPYNRRTYNTKKMKILLLFLFCVLISCKREPDKGEAMVRIRCSVNINMTGYNGDPLDWDTIMKEGQMYSYIMSLEQWNIQHSSLIKD